MKDEIIIKTDSIQDRIYTIRGLQVMVDKDLAELYQVETKVLNQAVKRNINRFPKEFRFQLEASEKSKLVTNCDQFRNLKHSSVNPFVFTEQGVSMLSAVLRSDIAVKTSIKIISAFVKMRKFISTNAVLFQRLDKVEQKQFITDTKLDKIFKAIEQNEIKPKQGVFFDGQVFDAYNFVSKLIRSAKKSIVLIDNYIDDAVLTHFEKRKKGISLTILTKKISKQLRLDVEKFNKQYPKITLKEFSKAHDRFIIIDENVLYHFGASLKDLGKKWFAFSRMDTDTVEILKKMRELE